MQLTIVLVVKDFLESLSLGSGAVVIAVCSSLLTGLWLCARSVRSAWLIALLAPLVLSFCLYWLPVWLGANASEYFSWAPLFIGMWFLAGAVPSAVVVLIFGRRRAN